MKIISGKQRSDGVEKEFGGRIEKWREKNLAQDLGSM